MAAADLYRRYCRAHWIDRGVVAGFAEYPYGQNFRADVDSGPIVLGVGLAATGLGIAAAERAGDSWRLGRLVMQLPIARAAMRFGPHDLRSSYPFDSRYVTGSLMGDASLFGTLGLRVPR